MTQQVQDTCMEIAVYAFVEANDNFCIFVREIGQVAVLPANFGIHPKMIALEHAIEAAVCECDLARTADLCREYRQRWQTYLSEWRRQLTQLAQGANA